MQLSKPKKYGFSKDLINFFQNNIYKFKNCQIKTN